MPRCPRLLPGKSTLLNALLGRDAAAGADEARVVLLDGSRVADDGCRVGVFEQDLAQRLDARAVARELVAREARDARRDESLSDERVRGVLGALGLAGEKADRRLGELSGGEKARVALAVLALAPHNVLMLDEPSNHLDASTVSALVEALAPAAWRRERKPGEKAGPAAAKKNAAAAADGALVVVSHDQSFCEVWVERRRR